MPFYLGFDCSTQSLTAVVIAHDAGRERGIVFASSLVFDETLPHHGTRSGVLPQDDPAVAVSPPLMWVEALDVMMERLAGSRLDLGRLAAISGAAQQHGSVYLNRSSAGILRELDASRPLASQVGAALSREVAPIWMDSSTAAYCAEIAEAVGGDDEMLGHTGSRATERFAGPQIRKFFRESPAAYEATAVIHLVSSFCASLLAGRHAPLDPCDASGMNLMDLETRRWWPPALDRTAPGLASRLPAIVPSCTAIGTLSRYWRERYRLPPAKVVVWSGDNPCSLVGVGLVREGILGVSLGTSDTFFGPMREPRVDRSGSGHVFGAPTGDFMGLTCARNGSLARDRVRREHGLDWDGFSRALEIGVGGSKGRILLPWYEPETTPRVLTPGVRRFGPPAEQPEDEVRALVEGQMMSLMLHSQWMGVSADRIHATGGAASNPQILQVLADVSGAEVYRLDAAHSAALGAALCAARADLDPEGRIGWDEFVSGFAEPVDASPIRPDPARHALYEELLKV